MNQARNTLALLAAMAPEAMLFDVRARANRARDLCTDEQRAARIEAARKKRERKAARR